MTGCLGDLVCGQNGAALGAYRPLFENLEVKTSAFHTLIMSTADMCVCLCAHASATALKPMTALKISLQ